MIYTGGLSSFSRPARAARHAEAKKRRVETGEPEPVEVENVMPELVRQLRVGVSLRAAVAAATRPALKESLRYRAVGASLWLVAAFLVHLLLVWLCDEAAPPYEGPALLVCLALAGIIGTDFGARATDAGFRAGLQARAGLGGLAFLRAQQLDWRPAVAASSGAPGSVEPEDALRQVGDELEGLLEGASDFVVAWAEGWASAVLLPFEMSAGIAALYALVGPASLLTLGIFGLSMWADVASTRRIVTARRCAALVAGRLHGFVTNAAGLYRIHRHALAMDSSDDIALASSSVHKGNRAAEQKLLAVEPAIAVSVDVLGGGLLLLLLAQGDEAWISLPEYAAAWVVLSFLHVRVMSTGRLYGGHMQGIAAFERFRRFLLSPSSWSPAMTQEEASRCEALTAYETAVERYEHAGILIAQLRRMTHVSKLQSKQEIEDLAAVTVTLLRRFDTDKSGALDVTEFKTAVRGCKIDEEQLCDADVQWLFDLIDADSGGTVDIEELARFVWGGGSPQGCKLHVRGVGQALGTEEALRAYFSKYGAFKQATVHKRQDQATGANTSWAVVTMEDEVSANAVLAVANTKQLIHMAKEPTPEVLHLTVARFREETAEQRTGQTQKIQQRDGDGLRGVIDSLNLARGKLHDGECDPVCPWSSAALPCFSPTVSLHIIRNLETMHD